ncbi:pyridoxamine 5'-phosphate oxidase family protein [Streptomyces erythrochromogenes]|uniref:pyridoxamine 5'-phosphate oxidase family protein n=1 Tax=Streptomyces erythrochromogenes TaxID=285574 RepID=UPI00370147E4
MKSRSPADGPSDPPAPRTTGKRTAKLGAEEALRLLESVGLGRIVFTRHALPAISPVSHLLDGDDIIVRVQDGATLAAVLAAQDGFGVVVAYEADAIDPGTGRGWSVVATGYASPVTDPAELNRYTHLLTPWPDAPESGAVRIRPSMVTGFMLRADVA